MTLLPIGMRVSLATGHTDMRKSFPLLALQEQEILHRDRSAVICFAFADVAATC
jgi:transposase